MQSLFNIRLLLLWLLAFSQLPAPLSAQENTSSMSELQAELQQLEATITDSLSMEKVVEKIYDFNHDLDKQLVLINFYLQLCEQYPHIPNRARWVRILAGYRYNALAWANNRDHADLAFQYLDSAQHIFTREDYEAGNMQNEYGRGVIYRHLGHSEKAMAHFDQYYLHYKSPFDSIKIANVQFQRGIIFSRMGQMDSCLLAFTEALQLEEQLGRIHSQVEILNSLGSIYRRTRQPEKSEATYQQAIAMANKLEKKDLLARICINYGNLKREQEEQTVATTLYHRALRQPGISGNLKGYVYENLGHSFLLAEQFDSSQYYLQRSFDIRKDNSSPRELALIEYLLGKASMKLKRYQEALPYLQRSLQTAVEQNDPENIAKCASALSEWHTQNEQFQLALEYYRQAEAARDIVLDEDIARQITEISTRYETEKKEAAIAQLELRDQLNQSKLKLRTYTIIGLAALALIMTVLFFQLFRQNKKIKWQNAQIGQQNSIIRKALAEKEVLLKEIHHRVKNNLQVISSLLAIQSRQIEDQRAREAIQEGRNRVQSMALIHQDLYKKDDLSSIEMKSYLSKLSDSLFKTYNTKGRQIQLQTEIDELALDVETVIPIGLIVNELMTNALKYAFPEDREGLIRLRLKEQEDHLLLSLSDDGVGIDPSHQRKDSFGMSLIQAFRQKLKAEVQFQKTAGTTVNLLIKNYKKVMVT